MYRVEASVWRLSWGYSLRLCVLLLGAWLVLINPAVAGLTIDGTAAERAKIQKWLRQIAKVDVVVDANTGAVTVPAGGGGTATTLRNITTSATNVTLDTVSGQANTFIGQWNSSVAGDPHGPSTGTQTVDMADLEGVGNIFNRVGPTPGTFLVHEIVEVFESRNAMPPLKFPAAHAKALKAEQDAINERGLTYVSEVYDPDAGEFMIKVRLANGQTRVTKASVGDASADFDWYTENTPCMSDKGLTKIADPDPQVWNYDFDAEGAHIYLGMTDTVNSAPQGVANAANGNYYVTESAIGLSEIRIFDPSGTQLGTLGGAEVIDPRHIDVRESDDQVFVAVEGAVLRYDSSGVLLGAYDNGLLGFDPRGVATGRVTIDAGSSTDGLLFVTDASSDQVYIFDVDLDLDVSTFQTAFGSAYLEDPHGVAIDATGLIYVADGTEVFRFDGDGTTYDVLGNAGNDWVVSDPAADFVDVDTVYAAGFLALDRGQSIGVGGLFEFDFEGALVSEMGVGQFQCPYAVDTQFSIDETVLVPTPVYSGERHLIWCPVSGGMIDSCTELTTALDSLGESYLVVNDLSEANEAASQLPVEGAVWALLGTFPDDHCLSQLEGIMLSQLVQNGTHVYLESADVWGFCGATPYFDWDGVEGLAVDGIVMEDGDDSFTFVEGGLHDGLDLTPYAAPYPQDQLGSDFTDRLLPTSGSQGGSGVDLAGDNAGSIWFDALQGYVVGVYYVTGSEFGNAISQSWELGGHPNTTEVVAAYLGAFEPPLPLDLFRRGDANNDGTVNIADAVYGANALFVPGSPPPACLDAADANDDGMFNIADVIFTANFLFVMGSPAPSNPFPGCGPDPTADSLECLGFIGTGC